VPFPAPRHHPTSRPRPSSPPRLYLPRCLCYPPSSSCPFCSRVAPF
jgi:hypothetical protein